MQDTVKEPDVKKLTGKPRMSSKATKMLLVALVVVAVLGAALWWWQTRAFETTDDAFITGHVTSVSARVAGRVLQVLVEDNQKVAAGDVLVKLDPATYQVKLDQAQANLNEAQQKLLESRAQYAAAQASAEQAKADEASAAAQTANAVTDLSRYNHLINSGAVSQQARDNADTMSRTTSATLLAARKRVAVAQAQADLAAAQIKTAQAVVQKNQAALEQAQLDLSYCDVTAAVSGLVTKKAVEPGDYLQVGQAVLSLVQEDVWVVANFKETQLKGMRPGQKAELEVDAYSGHTFQGHVDSLQAGTGAAFSLLPPENATGNYVKVVQRVPVKIVFDLVPGDAGMLLAPGMSVYPRVRVR